MRPGTWWATCTFIIVVIADLRSRLVQIPQVHAGPGSSTPYFTLWFNNQAKHGGPKAADPTARDRRSRTSRHPDQDSIRPRGGRYLSQASRLEPSLRAQRRAPAGELRETFAWTSGRACKRRERWT